MKNTFTRVFAIMTLATSISAFGLSEKPAKAPKTNSNNANYEATAAPSQAEHNVGKSDNNEQKSRERLIENQEKQWLHDVQGLVAG